MHPRRLFRFLPIRIWRYDTNGETNIEHVFPNFQTERDGIVGHLAYRGKKGGRKERFLSYSDGGHGLRIIERSREGAKLMEKVVPFIRGGRDPSCQ